MDRIPPADEHRTAQNPLSVRFCDGAMIAFAIWTLSCHATVLLGGNLKHLLLLSAAAGSCVLLHRWRFPHHWRRPAEGWPHGEQRSRPRPLSPFLMLVGLICGAIAFALLQAGLWTLLWWWWVTVLGVAAIAFVLRQPAETRAPSQSRAQETILWLLALTCAWLALCSHRPDRDDSFYVNLAVAAVDSPDTPLLTDDSLMGIPGLPLHLVAYRVHSLELLFAGVSYLSGIPAIYCFHFIAAALGGLLVPLCFARFFRWLTPRRWLWATCALLVVLLATGEAHRWYGNFALVRMWQGKAYFLFLLTPLIYVYALRFAIAPTLRGWFLLAFAQIGAIGCTSTALWAAPVASLIALSCQLRPFDRRDLKVFVLGAATSSYLIIIGSVLKGSIQKLLNRNIESMPLGSRLQEALNTMLGDSHILSFSVIAIACAWAFCPRGLARRFAIVAPLAVLLVLLNPYLAEWIVEHLTGPAYWRGQWALPLPTLMALLLITPLAWGARRGAMATLVALTAFASFIPSFGGLTKRNRVELHWPGLKVPKARYHIATELNRALPRGSVVVAPQKLSAWITTFHHHIYPVMVRRAYLRPQKETLGLEDVIHRESMTNFLDGETTIGNEAALFRSGLQRYDVQAVCLRTDVLTASEARSILRQEDFISDLSYGTYEVWLRHDLAAQPILRIEDKELPGLRDNINAPSFYDLDLESGALPPGRTKPTQPKKIGDPALPTIQDGYIVPPLVTQRLHN